MNPGFNDYQVRAHETAQPAIDGAERTLFKMLEQAQQPDGGGAAFPIVLSYLTMGLVGEAGEIANKVKKVIRDDGGLMTDEVRDALAKELGDVLWYLSELCSCCGVTLGDVAKANIKKLKDRQQRGTLQGSGDDR